MQSRQRWFRNQQNMATLTAMAVIGINMETIKDMENTANMEDMRDMELMQKNLLLLKTNHPIRHRICRMRKPSRKGEKDAVI